MRSSVLFLRYVGTKTACNWEQCSKDLTENHCTLNFHEFSNAYEWSIHLGFMLYIKWPFLLHYMLLNMQKWNKKRHSPGNDAIRNQRSPVGPGGHVLHPGPGEGHAPTFQVATKDREEFRRAYKLLGQHLGMSQIESACKILFPETACKMLLNETPGRNIREDLMRNCITEKLSHWSL